MMLLLPLLLGSARGDASCFPLLSPGTHAGVNGGPGLDAGAFAAYAGIVASGGDLAQIGVTWAAVEPSKGVFDFTALLAELEWAKDHGQHVVVGVNAINTNVLSIPADLLNPLDHTKLRSGLTWASPELIKRYVLVLEQAARIAYLGGGSPLLRRQRGRRRARRESRHAVPLRRALRLRQGLHHQHHEPQYVRGRELHLGRVFQGGKSEGAVADDDARGQRR